MHLPTISTLALLLSTPALAAQRKSRRATDLAKAEMEARVQACANAVAVGAIDGDYSSMPSYCYEDNYGLDSTTDSTTGSSGSGSGSGSGSSSGSGSLSGSSSSSRTGAGVRNGAGVGGALVLGVVAVVVAML
ncbi:uncharacterized protein H6S33_002917 [Morchella sextelata]|uniref:uncharacterized protein n=1 Tax=Morchella sextelata TaxID=1174677 RepID=UPI001D03FD61|nr:uncharacterized protein H6S33_002917 [Morchella sextelata]KAH0606929.1 hypothetical protein H6S33_002917 [Morchella sextelata]